MMNPMTSLKTYWSTLKAFLNNKKVPVFLLYFKTTNVTNFKKKAELFNLLFTEQCSITGNSSELPLYFLKKTPKNPDKSISAIAFIYDDIATLIKNLDPNKAHVHDMISLRLLKLCGESVCKPLDLLFQSCVKQGKFSRKENVVPLHKKGDK